MSFLFLGYQFQDSEGRVGTLSTYFPEVDEEGNTVSIADKQAELLSKMSSLKFTPVTTLGSADESGDTNTREGVVLVNSLVRSSKKQKNRDGDITVVPVIDLYTPWYEFPNGVFGEYRFVRTYLDTDEQVQAFEEATGLNLDELPLYQGQGAPVRRFNMPPEDYEVQFTPTKVRFIEEPYIERATGEQAVYPDGTLKKRKRFVGWASEDTPVTEFVNVEPSK